MQPRSPLTACQRTDLAPTAQPATFAASAPLSAFFTLLATNIDRAGRSFVSVVEATDPRLRIYATQFHPEKRAAYIYIERESAGDLVVLRICTAAEPPVKTQFRPSRPPTPNPHPELCVVQEPPRVGSDGLRRAAAGHPALPRRGRRRAVLRQLFRGRVSRLRPPLRLSDRPVEAAHLSLSAVAIPADFLLARLR